MIILTTNRFIVSYKHSYEMTECLNMGSLSSVIVINLMSSFLHRG